MRASWRWPRTVVFVRELLGQVPEPSKRTSLRASVFETYTFPVTGLVTMSKRIVPTPVYGTPTSAGVLPAALITNTSSSSSEKRTALFQFRPSRSSHALCAGLNLTMIPVSACGLPKQSTLGAGRPPGMVNPPTLQEPAVDPPSHTRPPLRAVVWLPDWKTGA